jgi:hypothetical protein
MKGLSIEAALINACRESVRTYDERKPRKPTTSCCDHDLGTGVTALTCRNDRTIRLDETV